jgi:trigger factor
MEQALKKDIDASYKDTIMKRLLEMHHFDLPETLVEQELTAMIRQTLQSRQRKTADTRESAPTSRTEEIAKLQEEHRPEADRRVKMGLILEAIADKEGLTVSNEELNEEIARLASEVKMSVEEVTRMIQGGGQESLEDLRSRILADKTLDFVYRHAVIQG